MLQLQHTATVRLEDIIGVSPAIIDIKERIRRVAPTDATCLLEGETGVGKGLIARAIHHASPRVDQAFVSIECGSIPRELIEAEIFGYDQGAYTGAKTTGRTGLLETADHGTVFLDELEDLDLGIQGRLLNFLQERTVRRIGSNKARHLDVRVVAAVNTDLREMVEQRKFRRDLYFRLAQYPISVPPLRDRRGDVPILVDHLLDNCAAKITKEAVGVLSHYDWPGNVRELENLLGRARLDAETGEIDAKLIAPYLISDMKPSAAACTLPLSPFRRPDGMIMSLSECKDAYFSYVLQETGGNVARAIAIAGVGKGWFYRRRKQRSSPTLDESPA